MQTIFYKNGFTIKDKNRRMAAVISDDQCITFHAKRLLPRDQREELQKEIKDNGYLKQQWLERNGWILCSLCTFTLDIFEAIAIAYSTWLELKEDEIVLKYEPSNEDELPEGWTVENTIVKQFTGKFDINTKKDEDI